MIVIFVPILIITAILVIFVRYARLCRNWTGNVYHNASPSEDATIIVGQSAVGAVQYGAVTVQQVHYGSTPQPQGYQVN
jgi:hypothetical protein